MYNNLIKIYNCTIILRIMLQTICTVANNLDWFYSGLQLTWNILLDQKISDFTPEQMTQKI